MSGILKDFFQNYHNSLEDIILKNCKNFLAYKSISPSYRIRKQSPIDKYKSFLFNGISCKLLLKNNDRLKLVKLSRINGRNMYNRENKKIFSNDNCINQNQKNIIKNNFELKFKTFDKPLGKVKLENEKNEKIVNIIKNFDNSTKSKIKDMRKTQSAKLIESDKNYDQKLIKNKVNFIIKDLLSKDIKNYQINENISRNIFPLSKVIHPMRYIEYNMKNYPNKKNLFKSYHMQMKYFMDEEIRSFLIEGINDYHENLKKYKDITFDYFSRNNNSKRKYIQKQIKSIILNGKSDKLKNTTLKPKILVCDPKFEKFKKNYLNAYNEKGFNKDKNLYFKYINNNEFKNMMSFEDKLKMAFNSSTKNLTKYINRNTVQKFRKKYML